MLNKQGDNNEVNLDKATVKMLTEEPPDLEITLHSLSGWVAVKTMHITATTGMHEVITLIDNGSTHNFNSHHMANLLHLQVKLTKAFTV